MATSPSRSSGALAGLGGAWLAIDIRAYNQDQIAGRGFQGLAALIFGNWRPARRSPPAQALFAYAQSLTQRSAPPGAGAVPPGRSSCSVASACPLVRRQVAQASASCSWPALSLLYFLITKTVNNQLVFITPYLVTLLVLTFASQRLRPPAAEGRPWRKGRPDSSEPMT